LQEDTNSIYKVTVQLRTLHLLQIMAYISHVRKHSGWDATSHRAAILHGLLRYSSARLNC